MTKMILLSCIVFTISYCAGQPRFLEKDENNTLQGTEGNNLTLTCVLEQGLPPEQLLLNSNGITVAYGGPEDLNYTFKPSRADHLIDYICIANSSEFDNPLVDRVTLYIKHIPDPPTFVLSKTCRSKFISWTAGASGNLPQVFYIEYKKLQSKLWERIGPINQTDTTEMTYQISELSLDTFYEIRIFAENEIGQSIYSSVLGTIAADIKSTTEENFASKHVIPLKYWLVLGAVSSSLIIFCILSHVCRHRVTRIRVVATNNRQPETIYEEIGSVQYHFISVAPVIPAPRQYNIQFNSNRYEIERQNSSWRSSDIAESTISDNGSGQTVVEREVIEEVVNLRTLHLNDNLEPDNNTLEDQTDSAEHSENHYTPLRQETNQEHSYNFCSTAGVFREQNTRIIVDNNDYINLML